MLWEVIGWCSFFLIGFWSDRTFATTSATKAVLINRLPDMILFFALFLTYFYSGVSNFQILHLFILDNSSVKNSSYLFFVFGILYVVASCGKSAQCGFSGWLVAAMEGPTPVSALMHAATLVTAGAI